ncbi:MAG: tetratricopeptide repeat protein [Rhodospirillales bacterium]
MNAPISHHDTVSSIEGRADALRQARRVLAGDPRNAELWLDLGMMLQDMHWDLREAIAEAANLITNPNYEGDARAVSEARKAVDAFDRLQAEVAGFLRETATMAGLPASVTAPSSAASEAGKRGTVFLVFAAAGCRAALALAPGFLQAHGTLGTVLFEAGDFEDAAEAFRSAIAVDPGVPEIHYFLGRAEQEAGHVEAAAGHYRDAAARDSGYVTAWCRLANACLYTGALGEADAAMTKALEISPDAPEAFAELGLLRVAQGRYEEAADAAMQLARAERSLEGGYLPVSEVPERLNATKLRHDIEQLEHLVSHGRIDSEWADVVPEYRRLLEGMDGQAYRAIEDADPPVTPQFIAAYRGLVHVAPAPVIPGGALNPALDVKEIVARYQASDMPVVDFGNLLKPEAAESLRRFCLESTIWFNVADAGDVGTIINDGFACPLLFQIAGEIREAFSPVFDPYPFTSCWAYKYYDKFSGVRIHADEGAVSVNFWLTPDDANLQPDTGGLVFWKKMFPDGYFRMSQVEKHESLLRAIEEPGVEAVTVPFGYNRAAVFHSGLIHRTDDLDFKEGYGNRRINITLVYGRPAR